MDPLSPDDCDDVARWRTEPEVFGRFYEQHAPDLVTYFYRRTGCGQTAADLCGETFAQALLSADRYQPRSVPVVAWLYGIAKNQLHRYRRRRGVEARYQARLGIERVVLSDAELDAVERSVDLTATIRQLDGAMGALPTGQADAVRLRFIDGCDYPEIARQLGVSEGAVRVRVSRGLAALELAMGEVDVNAS